MTRTTHVQGYAVVAVDGPHDCDAAVSLAATEAQRHGLELRVVHVVPLDVPLGRLLLPGDAGVESFASRTLANAARVATDAAPDVKVTTHDVMGGRVSEVVAFAGGAEFIAVGRRPRTALDRAWWGGTLDGIASHARCTVLMVPGHLGGDPARPLRVVAGFKSAGHSAQLFEAAFRVADELGAEVQVVHAWQVAGMYDDIITRRVKEPTWNREQASAIRALLCPWRKSYPHVPVRVDVIHEEPTRALIEVSRASARLVLVKPLRGRLVHHLGRTARGLLRFAECPVHVVPAEPASR